MKAIYRRPPTSCAHRLRKPDRTCEPLAPSVARRPRRKRAPYPHLEAHPTARRRETPHVGLRRARPAGPAAGLGRRTPGEPERLPSDRPESCDPSRLAAFVVHLHDVATAPCRLPRAGATSSKDGWPRHAIPYPCVSPRVAPQRAAGREKDACHRLLQPTYDPSTQRTARFPGALPVSLRDPCGRVARRLTRAHLRPMASGEPPGEASLDGEPPASALSQPVTARARSGYPDHGGGRDAARSWRSFDRTLLTRCTPRLRRFQPRAGFAT